MIFHHISVIIRFRDKTIDIKGGVLGAYVIWHGIDFTYLICLRWHIGIMVINQFIFSGLE